MEAETLVDTSRKGRASLRETLPPQTCATSMEKIWRRMAQAPAAVA